MTATARQQNGGDAGKIQAGLVFDSSTARIIRDALHRKIENGANYGLYLPADKCVEYTIPPPPTEPTEVFIRISESYDGGITYPVNRYFKEIQKP